jgi:hypothetical protein
MVLELPVVWSGVLGEVRQHLPRLERVRWPQGFFEATPRRGVSRGVPASCTAARMCSSALSFGPMDHRV